MPWHAMIYEFLVHVLLSGSLLLAIASLAVLTLREPARRIRVIQLTLAGLFAIPFLVAMPGFPRLAVLPARFGDQTVTAQAPLTDVATQALLVPRPSTTRPEPNRSARPTIVPSISIPTRPSFSEPSRLGDFRWWIVVLYAAGSLAMFVWSLLGLLARGRLLQTARPADDRLQSLFEELADPASRRVRLLVSPRAAQPCAFGLLRPTIVLPPSLARSTDSASLRYALAHEWSHIAHGDIGYWSLATVARILFFPQPLVWLLRQRLRLDQDHLADAAAAGTGSPEDYAEFLTIFSRQLRSRLPAPGLGMASRHSELHRRVLMLIDRQHPLESVAPKCWTVVALVLGISTIALVASLRAEPPSAESTSAPTSKENDEAAPQKARPIQGETFEASASESLEYKIRRAHAVLRAYREQLAKLEKLPSDDPLKESKANKVREEILKMELTLGQLESQIEGGVTHSFVTTRAMLPRTSTKPFAGKIRPGDILSIEILGGFPGADVPLRTVEPDGNVALVAAYGTNRLDVAGKSLIEAGNFIEAHLSKILKNPKVLVTYAGHDNDVVPSGSDSDTPQKPLRETTLTNP